MNERTARLRAYAGAGIASVASIAAIVGFQQANPRLLASWHGLLHAGIVERIRLTGVPPENPFFAGEPLPYYWVWHAVAATLADVVSTDPLTALQALTMLGLAILWFAAARIGCDFDHEQATAQPASNARLIAGLLIGWLALAGSTPLGPLLAIARAALTDAVLFERAPALLETLRISDEGADRWMTHPLIGALFWNWDWRIGPNAIWFLDNSSRALALGLLLALAGLARTRQPGARAIAGGVLLSGAVAALNPLVGMAAGLSLAGAGVVIGWWRNESGRFRLPVAIALGLLLASPSYLHIVGGGSGGVGVRWWFGPALLAIAFAMAPVWAVAIAGSRRAAHLEQHGDTTLLLAGTVLLGAGTLLHLAEGNEHNLMNAAGVVLAVPAAWWASGSPRRAGWLAASFLPIVVASLLAFSGRPGLPLDREGDTIRRSDAVEAAYAFIRAETPVDSILVDRVDAPLRMAGNVSELPALTGRAVWVDHPSYLTTGFPEFEERARISRKLMEGAVLTGAERAALKALGRPLYLLRTDGGPSETSPVVFEAHGLTIQQLQIVEAAPARVE